MQERELLTFALGLAVLIYIVLQHRKLQLMRGMGLPLTGFALMVLGWFMNLLDNQFPYLWLQILEHAFHALAAMLFLYWTWTRTRVATKS